MDGLIVGHTRRKNDLLIDSHSLDGAVAGDRLPLYPVSIAMAWILLLHGGHDLTSNDTNPGNAI